MFPAISLAQNHCLSNVLNDLITEDSSSKKILSSSDSGLNLSPADVSGLRSLRNKRIESLMNNEALNYGNYFSFKVKDVKVDDLPGDTKYLIDYEFSKIEGLILSIKTKKKSVNDPHVLLDQLIDLTTLKFGFQHPAQAVENSINIEKGSLRAQELLLKKRLKTMELYLDHAYTPKTKSDLRPYFSEQISTLEGQVGNVRQRMTKLKEQRSITNKEIESRIAKLVKSNKDLNLMIAQNDRKGVADFLENSIKWHEMEPTQAGVWKSWIEAIRKPAGEDGVVLFRGHSGNQIPLNDNERPYILSQALTVGEESFNQRGAMLSGALKKHYDNPDIQNPTYAYSFYDLLKMHYSWTRFSTPSPVISTSSLKVAREFLNGRLEKADYMGLSSIKVNPDRAFPNVINPWKDGKMIEEEILIPFFVFPDEVVHTVQGKLGKSDELINQFVSKTEEEIGREISNTEKIGRRPSQKSKKENMLKWWNAINQD
jgi:hypothetical protein